MIYKQVRFFPSPLSDFYWTRQTIQPNPTRHLSVFFKTDFLGVHPSFFLSSRLLLRPIDRLLPSFPSDNLLDPPKLPRPPFLNILVGQLIQPVEFSSDKGDDLRELDGEFEVMDWA